MSNGQQQNPDSASPVDPGPGRFRSQRSLTDEKKPPQITIRPRTSTSSSSGLSVQTPRTARFAEATSVDSPIGPSATGRNPFADPPAATRHIMPQPQPSDVGFGYVSDNNASRHASFAGVEVPITPASPLKSALKVPGTPGRQLNPLSPTFQEEQILEKAELSTDKDNAKDLVRSARVSLNRLVANVCYRKSRLEFEWPRCVSEGPISAAVSSSCLCSRQPSPFSMPRKVSHLEANSQRGRRNNRSGRRSLFSLSLAYLWPSPSACSMHMREVVTGEQRRPRFITPSFQSPFSYSALSCGRLALPYFTQASRMEMERICGVGRAKTAREKTSFKTTSITLSCAGCR